MAKKKKSVALFEVVARGGDEDRDTGVGVPEWMQGETATAQQPAPPAGSAGKKAIRLTTSPAAATAAQVPGGVHAAPAVEPVVSTAGGRLKLSLNYVTCTVVVLAAGLLLVLAFVLGRASVRTADSDGPAVAGLAGGAGGATRSPGRVAGKHYLVIQEIAGTSDVMKKDALDIVRYCKRHGKQASVVRSPDGKSYWVWSRKGFGSDKSPEALAYAKEISGLGRQYRKDTNKRYDFSRYDRSKRLRPQFWPAAGPTGKGGSTKGRRE